MNPDNAAPSGDRPAHVSVLGPILCVDSTGHARAFTGRVATVAAWLVAHRGQPLTVGALSSLLWPNPGSAPGDSSRAVRRLIRQARAGLTSVPEVSFDLNDDTMTLRIPPERVDAEVFTDLLDAARTDPDAGSMLALRTALDGWRGDPYPELEDYVDEVPEARRLTALRREAEVRLLADRIVGEPDPALVSDVTAMVVASPDDLAFRYLLAVSLYRDGRRAEALRVAHECRTIASADRGRMVRLVDVLESKILRDEPFAVEFDLLEFS